MCGEEGCHDLFSEKGDQSGAEGEQGVGTTMPVATEMSDAGSIENTTHGDMSGEDDHADQGESGYLMLGALPNEEAALDSEMVRPLREVI